MNVLQIIARKIIRKSFHLSVRAIEQFHDIDVYDEKTRQLGAMPEGTLGNDIALCLKNNRLRLVPGYESHDLKHVLLGFKMTPIDEIRLQAFMIGNGNYSIPSFAIFTFGAILLPDCWSTFHNDFKKGRNTQPVSQWTIDEYAHCDTATLQQRITNHSTVQRNPFDMKKLVRFGAISAILFGILGMLFSLPFLFSSSLPDLVGAGFPFVGGAILASAGLIALSNLAKNTKGTAQPVAANNSH